MATPASKIKIVTLNQFGGGMVNDPRDPRPDTCRTCINFDAFTNRRKLVPFISSVTGDASASTNKIAALAYDGTQIIGWGDTGAGLIRIFKNTDPTTATWTGVGNPGVTNNTSALQSFIYYPTTGRVYGFGAGSHATDSWSYDATNGTGSNNDQVSTLTSCSNSLVHSKDDVLYMGYANFVASKNGAAAWNVTALTLPTQFAVTALCEFGNYLAIGCRSTTTFKSRVFLWDRDSSVTTLAESIDWGEGDLKILDTLDGTLIGVSSTTGTYQIGNSRLAFRSYSGGSGAVKFNEMYGTVNDALIPLFHQKINNRILFTASMTLQSTFRQGVWSIGHGVNGFGVTIYRLPNNDTALTSGIQYGFIQVGDYLYQAYNDNGAYAMSKTMNSSVVYSAMSTFETVINPDMPLADKTHVKSLAAVSVSTEPMGSGQSITLSYRVDGATGWTAILTQTTAGNVTTEKITDATDLPLGVGRELEFQITSTGGAVPTELKYSYEPHDSLI